MRRLLRLLIGGCAGAVHAAGVVLIAASMVMAIYSLKPENPARTPFAIRRIDARFWELYVYTNGYWECRWGSGNPFRPLGDKWDSWQVFELINQDISIIRMFKGRAGLSPRESERMSYTTVIGHFLVLTGSGLLLIVLSMIPSEGRWAIGCTYRGAGRGIRRLVHYRRPVRQGFPVAPAGDREAPHIDARAVE